MSTSDSDKKEVKEAAKPYLASKNDDGVPSEPDTDPAGDPAFVARMQACAERAGSVNALARKAGLSQSVIRRYFAGGEPTRKVLIAISNAAEVDFLWLATGAGNITGEAGRKAAQGSMPVKLNADSLRLAIETVEESLADSGRHLASDRKADMIAAAYELFTNGEGNIDKSIVLRLVKSAN